MSSFLIETVETVDLSTPAGGGVTDTVAEAEAAPKEPRLREEMQRGSATRRCGDSPYPLPPHYPQQN